MLIKHIIGAIPIESFNEVVGILTRAAYESFAAAIGVVSSFNSVLPDSFTYLVAAFSDSSGQNKTIIGCVRKDIFPGYHDMVSKNIFPIIFLQEKLPDGKCEIKKLYIDKVSFSGGEKLPDL
ncbi:hypothetical protein A2567_02285 [Candidatus Azambacteria bacterium RIFOXYD1_FULL_42_11]|uniref:Uncharacterized protein n=4 Tax=Candidatus Azamiibacteriota TaxID=1752741 RepID=A0A0G1C736_9BACT|nr:MAG: hypothetical protein UV07_C0022G0011 [Candidatus Azambacteria bacterium GW2011_GWB1_42_17]KKS45448.1 MAG: hypothetical protein UV10_C0024G0002 [Candidatus Azambacteria bacterium GW2011_GWA1_42_19]KKS75491.1 MAG: hypothetical protein UV48_C0011G0012 [Candidatus Azambacteria bacterium GW2011_GWA2_42_9]KKS88395.1 MAG: hypothetical protein UV62_C0008G0014 [Parcubacteria group bacterium GW2011_GWC1_43_11]OGD43297.1 MAG: hypothetical protein A2567_02285 [Candidatus Azambacteria bacterium RIFO